MVRVPSIVSTMPPLTIRSTESFCCANELELQHRQTSTSKLFTVLIFPRNPQGCPNPTRFSQGADSAFLQQPSSEPPRSPSCPQPQFRCPEPVYSAPH